MIKIFGAKANIRNVDNFLTQVEKYAKEKKLVIQSFNADVIFGKNHLISSVEHAQRALEQKTNTTNSLEMEILLYASGERQLKLAIPKMGVKKGETNVAFVFIGEKINDKKVNDFLNHLSLKKDDKILEGDIITLRKFGLKEDEIRTVTKSKYGDLILEKVAMVDIIK